jgi:hypothetical protein
MILIIYHLRKLTSRGVLVSQYNAVDTYFTWSQVGSSMKGKCTEGMEIFWLKNITEYSQTLLFIK